MLAARQLARDSFNRDWDPAKAAFQNEILAHEPLETGHDHAASAGFIEPNHQHKPVTGHNHTAKPDFIHASEADHGGSEKVVLLRVVARKLGHGFEHHHAWHQGHAGHVPTNPEFLIRDLLVRRARMSIEILIEDRGKLLHFVTLRIEFSNIFDIRNRIVKVEQARLDDEWTFHLRLGLDLPAFGLTRLRVGWATSVIRFLELMVWFGHEKIPRG